jgi:agmatinase
MKTNPNLQLLDPVLGQVRDKNTGKMFCVSSEALQLIVFFMEPRELGDNFELVGKIFETDDIESLKVFLQELVEQGVLVDSDCEKKSQNHQLVISDIALVEKPILSCLSLPVAGLESEYSYEYALVGLPFDLGTTGYPGARFGPARIRELSATMTDYRASFQDLSCEDWYSEEGKVLCAGKKIVDVGDVIHQVGEPFSTFYNRSIKTFDRLRERGSMPIIIGGDHSCLYPAIVSAKKFAKRPVHLIIFDAHTDLADYDDSISHNHGNVVSRILSEGIIEKLTHIGLRGMVGKPKVHDRYTPIYSNQCYEVDSIMELIRLGQEELYISFDIDSIDPVFAPGTGTPVPFGIKHDVALSCVCKLLNENDVMGFDLVEYNPMRDISDATGNLILHMLPRILDSFRSHVD